MFNFLSHLSFYWHLQKCRSRRALAFRSWRLGAQQPCVGTLPIASFRLSLLILISCFCNHPVENWAGSLAGATGMGIKPFAGPGCCLGDDGLVLGLQPIVSSSRGLSVWVFGHCVCRALWKTQSWAGAGGWRSELAGKSSPRCRDGTECLSGGRGVMWLWLEMTGTQWSGWEGRRCRRAELWGRGGMKAATPERRCKEGTQVHVLWG